LATRTETTGCGYRAYRAAVAEWMVSGVNAVVDDRRKRAADRIGQASKLVEAKAAAAAAANLSPEPDWLLDPADRTRRGAK
jgi:hypothetical protein